MQKDFSIQTIGAFLFGLLVGGLFTSTFIIEDSHFNTHDDTHPIADPYDTDYHVHADFLIYINDELIDLSDDMFMTTGSQNLHGDAHLHDNNGDVKHIHAEGITFVEFLESLQMTLENDCIELFDERRFCSDETSELQLFVNDEPYQADVTEYVPVDNDRILVYYGSPESENLSSYLESVPDDACYYSGTCPERGIAPDEECGLTCEL